MRICQLTGVVAARDLTGDQVESLVATIRRDAASTVIS